MFYQEGKMNKTDFIIREEIGKLLVDLALTHIKTWAKKELDYVRHAIEYPACVPLASNTWVIGKHQIKSIDEHKNICTVDSKIIHVFYSKKASILYAAFEKLKKYEMSTSLLEQDRAVSRAYDDLNLYEKKLKSKNLDSFKVQLFRCRAIDSKQKFKKNLKELEKTLQTAKYMKVWDKIL